MASAERCRNLGRVAGKQVDNDLRQSLPAAACAIVPGNLGWLGSNEGRHNKSAAQERSLRCRAISNAAW